MKRSASDDWAASAPPSASGENNHKRLKTEAGGDGCGFTHVYLCIDRSGSMNNRDVATSDGAGVMSRYDAVFAAAAHLVQLQRGKGTAIDFSLILWNDEAEWIFRNRNAEESLSLLAKAKTSSPPRLGTNFSNCFKLLRECIVVESKVKDEIKRPGIGSDSASASSLVIFLSDGRPGDLRHVPPKLGERIQPTYQRHRQTYVSAGGHLDALEPHLPPGALHFVGIHESGYPCWLQCLAERYNGTLHRSTLDFGQADDNGGGNEPAPAGGAVNGDNENEPRIQAAAAAVANQEDVNAVVNDQNLNMGNQHGGGGGKYGEEEEEEEEEKEEDDDKDAFDPNVTDGGDDDDLEFVEEVSANERIRRNVANGEVISVASQSQSQSIMDTFSSLSQSISIYHESQQQSQDYNDDDDDDGDDEDLYSDEDV